MVTPGSFRQQFNEFANVDVYSDFAITTWTNVALSLLDAGRWDTLLDYGTSLYVAHKLVLSRRNALASLTTAVPGQVVGIQTSKSIDKVAASYDSASVALEGAGQYNSTAYGIELWQLMGQIGAGGMQVSGGFAANSAWNGFH